MQELFDNVTNLVSKYNETIEDNLLHLAYFPELSTWTLIHSNNTEENEAAGDLMDVEQWLEKQLKINNNPSIQKLLKRYAERFKLGYYVNVTMFDDGSGSVRRDEEALISFNTESELIERLKNCIKKNNPFLYK